MKVIMLEPGQTAQIVEIGNGLEPMQSAVDGYIEAIYPFEDEEVVLICNEEGKINRMELNRAVYDETGEMIDIIAGPMFICSLGEEDFASIQGEMLEKYMEKFKHPEVFVKIGNDILAMKIPENQNQHEKQTHKNHIHR